MSYELYDPYPEQPQQYAPPAYPLVEPPIPPPPPPPRRSNRAWVVVGIVAAVLVPIALVAACGFGGVLVAIGEQSRSATPSTSATPSSSPTPSATPYRPTVRPAGARYDWQVPTGYVQVAAPSDLRNSEPHTAAAGLNTADTTNILVTNGVPLAVDTGTLSAETLRDEFDKVVTTLGHDAKTRTEVTVNGYSALRYDFNFATAQAYSYFVFKGTDAVQVLCRWADHKVEIIRGCDDLLATLTIG
ncbi:hypothetical protein [Cryptosporangium aurantiacum]|uniref:Uncharacterized protein n=1 Tax=Cryptosporangium aurantiacum TaxID=134849 RepID=A0A1M7QVN7_9ACTN|nr:hypothetical protein [Cryptosporangium aurantiacum]SHN35991.1 hypothetical protein SAMN05443668_105466 [Cryptosporangium aurantiacum]